MTPGVWKVVYAPHTTTIAGFLGADLLVRYKLEDDFTISSTFMATFP